MKSQAWNFVILGARSLELCHHQFFKGAKAKCQGTKAIKYNNHFKKFMEINKVK